MRILKGLKPLNRHWQTAFLSFCVLSAAAQEPVNLVAYPLEPNGVPRVECGEYCFSGSPIAEFTLHETKLSYFVGMTGPFFPSGGGLYGPDDQAILPWFEPEISDPYPPFPGAFSYGGEYTVSPQQADQLRAGLCYVRLTNANFPDGALRGQVCPRTPQSDCDLDGVADKLDLCEGTRPGDAVDQNGCSAEQLQNGVYFATHLYGAPTDNPYTAYGTFWWHLGALRYSVWFPTNFNPVRVTVQSGVDHGYDPSSVPFDLTRTAAQDGMILYRGQQPLLYWWDVYDLYYGQLYITADSPLFPHRTLRGQIQSLTPCSWKSRGDYLSSVYEEARRIWREGQISFQQRNDIMEAARLSNCGKQQPR